VATPTTDTPAPRSLVTLLALGGLSALLALYQWMELLVVRGGGQATCTFSSNVDCAQVWDSAFAGRVHDITGLPVAGLGVEWAVAAFVLSLWLTYRVLGQAELPPLIASVRVWAALGFLSCITFSIASARLGVVCPTCLLTYAFTTAFAAAAFLWLPGKAALEAGPLLRGLPRALAIAVPLHVALLFPASRTPKSTQTELAKGPSDEQVLAYFERLTPPEKQATADARKKWLEGAVPQVPVPPTRVRLGPENAPVKLVDFTDVLCGHCRMLVGMLSELRKALPPGKLSIEARFYPLDGECNPRGGSPKGDGIRCTGAKAQICLEGAKDFWDLHDKLFEHQAELTSKEKVLEIASSGSVPRAELEACINAPETMTKLQTDIAWAEAYNIDGTPLVLLNGKETYPVGAFLFGMAMSGGDPNSKYFAHLPAASP
jgi:serine/threonine-protein kinase